MQQSILSRESNPFPPNQPAPEAEVAPVDAVLEPFRASAPVNVVAAANKLGINVYSDNLPRGISGILRKDSRLGGKSGFVILVDRNHHPNRQRFTVAHEIGHFALHRQRAETGIEDDEFYRALSGPLERQANQFAADLLMPWPLVRSLQNQGIVMLSELAKKLEVSQQALAIRLGIPYARDWG